MLRTLTYAEAIREATEQEMERDSAVIVLGLGVDDVKAMYGTTEGLVEKFGHERISDTPLSEDAITGAVIGAALAGLRPIHVHQRMDFLLLAMNQLINVAAKSRYMFGGRVSVPIVIRAIIGRSWGQGAQHSQALHSFFMHVPGLKVVAPTTPYDVKGLMIESIRDDNPVIFVEHRLLHRSQVGYVPPEPYSVPFGKARVLGEGDDVTIIGISHMAVECLRSRGHLAGVGIGAEVIDPVSLSPLDMGTILRSVEKTGRLLVVDNAWVNCGASAEIVARTAEHFQGTGLKVVRRMGFAPVPCPTTRVLEDSFYPNGKTIAAEAYRMIHKNAVPWMPEGEDTLEAIQFKGPF